MTKSQVITNSSLYRFACAICACVFLFSHFAHAAAGAPPQTFTLDGQLFSDTMMTTPLLDSSVLMDIKILDSTNLCLIYEESQVVDTASTGGFFNIKVGSVTGASKRTSMNDPGNPMPALFQNLVPVLQSTNFCPSGYTPTAYATRVLRVTISTSAGFTETFADMTMDAVPNAFVAETLQGLKPANLVQTDTGSLTQANVANIFSPSNYAQLVMLLAGSSNQYVARASDGAATVPSLPTNPASPAAGQIWFNTSGNSLVYYDGSGYRTVGTSGGSVSSVATGAGLTGGTITSTGTISIASSGVVSSMLAPGAVTSTKLDPAINISTTGNINANNGTFNALATNYVNLYASGSSSQFVHLTAAAGANYPLALPAATGAAGTVLATDGSGNLSWAANGGAGSSSQWINNGSSIYYGSGNVGIGSTTPVSKLDVAGSVNVASNLYVGGSGFANANFINGGVLYQNGGDPFTRLQSVGNGNARIELQSNAASGAALDAGHESGRIDIGGYNGSGWISRAASMAGVTESAWTSSSTPMALAFSTTTGTTFSEKMRLTGGGNLGIGTNNPLKTLQVGSGSAAIQVGQPNGGYISTGNDGRVTFGSNLYVDQYNGARTASTNTGGFGFAGMSMVYGSIGFYTGAGNTTLDASISPPVNLFISAGGTVGVGTNNPAGILDVVGSGSNSAMVVPRDSLAARPTAPVNGMIRYNTTSNNLETYASGGWAGLTTSAAGGGSSQWTTSGANIYYVSSGGVGIGTTTPVNALDVNGSVSLGGGGVSVGAANSLAVAGRVGIGSATPAWPLDVNSFSSTAYVYAAGVTSPAAGYSVSVSNGSSVDGAASLIGFNTKNLAGTTHNAYIGAVSTAAATNAYEPSIVFGTRSAVSSYAERMRIDPAGNVAIGTTSATGILTLSSTGGNSIDIALNRGQVQQNGKNSYAPNDEGRISFFQVPAENYIRYFDLVSNGATGNRDGNFRFFTNQSSGTAYERLRIDGIGNVGIGTTAAGAILDVYGVGSAQSAMLVPRDSTAMRPSGINGMIRYNTTLSQLETYSSGGWAGVATGGAGGGASQWTTNGANIYYGSTGNVGIGSSVPAYALDVSGTARASNLNVTQKIWVNSPGSAVSPNYSSNYDQQTGLYMPGSGVIVFTASGQEAMRIASPGNVGIGSTSPNYKLDIVGTANVSSRYMIGGVNAVAIPSTESLAVGNTAAATNSTASLYNTAVGYQTLNANSSGAYNSALGYNALASDTAWGNSAFGALALPFNTSGGYNVALGFNAGGQNTIGNQNTYIGAYAGRILKTNGNNTAVGHASLFTADGGDANTAIGQNSGVGVTTGGYNTLIGSSAGYNITTGNSNIAIGASTSVPNAAGSNQLNIGNLVYGNFSSGFFGIGTTTPQAILDVNGSGTTLSAMIVPRDSTAMRPAGVNGMLRYNTTLAQLETYSSGAWAGLASGAGGSGSSPWTVSGANIYYNSTGNVGIGTNAPGGIFDVQSGGVSRILVGPGAVDGVTIGQRLANDGYTDLNLGTVNNKIESSVTYNDLRFYASGAERLRVTSLGYIGINSTTPTGILDVEGGTAAASTAGTNITLAAQNGGTGTSSGGNINITAGFAQGAANAGSVNITGGGNVVTGYTGGNVNISGGVAASGNNPGSVNIVGGTANNSPGGSTSLRGSDASGNNQVGGTATVAGGTGGFNGSGGAVSVNGGTNGSYGAAGGALTLTSGSGGIQGAGGNITLATGAGGTNATGGNSGSILLLPGAVSTGTVGRVGIGTSGPLAILDVYTTTPGASAIVLPRDTTANRPAGANGMIRYNTSLNQLEAYSSGAWGGLASGSGGGGSSQWTTSGSNIYYNSTGNVGIGLSSPAASLDTNGAIYQRPAAINSMNNYLQTNASGSESSTSLNPGLLVDSHNGYRWGMDLGISFVSNRARTRIFGNSVGDISFAFHPGGTDPTTQTSLTDAMVIRGDTNYVGIGSSSPASILDIAQADADTKVQLTNSSSSATHYPSYFVYNYTGGNGGSGSFNVAASRGSKSSPAAVQSGDSLGTVGAFGQYDTTAGHFGQGAYQSFLADGTFSSTSYPTAIDFATAASGSTSPASRLRITSGGLVGINQTSPARLFHMTGTNAAAVIQATQTSSAGDTATLIFGHSGWWDVDASGQVGRRAEIGSVTTSTYGQNPALVFRTSNDPNTAPSERVRIDASGNVGIGSTSPGATLDVNGGIRPGSSTVVTAACASANEGTQRYNYSSHSLEICNGTNWMQVPMQIAGSTTNVTASGPPVGASIYTNTASCNYTPSYGTCSNINNGVWPANGTSGSSNGSCVSLQATTSQAIVLDLGAVKTINQVYVAFENNLAYASAGISFSNDNITYSSSTNQFADQYNSGSKFYSVALSPSVTARYVRLTNISGNASTTDSSFCQLAVGP